MKYLTILAILCATTLSAQPKKAQPVRTAENPLELVKQVYPNTEKIVEINKIWSKAVDAKGKQLGYVLSSEAYGKDIFGYMEDTPLLIVANDKKIVQKVFLYHHLETASFVKKLTASNYFDKYKGVKITDLEKFNIDAITGVTLTSRAVNETAQLVGKKAQENQPKK